MQPALGRERLQPLRQLRGFELVHLRVPDHVHAVGEAQDGLAQRRDDAAVVATAFVARVHQHHRAFGRRRHLALEAVEAVLVIHLGTLQLADVRREDAVVGGVQLEQSQLVLRAQQHLRKRGRAGVLLQHAVGVELAHQLHVVGHRLRQVVTVPEPQHALLELALLLRKAAFERVAARAGVGVDDAVGLVLQVHVAQHADERDVLEHIGVVAGVKGVSVGEHGGDLANRQRLYRLRPRGRASRTRLRARACSRKPARSPLR